MFRSLNFKSMPELLTIGIIAFLGLMTLVVEGVASEKTECGAGNVSKLKYADPVKDIHLYLN